jgi:hypothetical protein
VTPDPPSLYSDMLFLRDQETVGSHWKIFSSLGETCPPVSRQSSNDHGGPCRRRQEAQQDVHSVLGKMWTGGEGTTKMVMKGR